MSKGELIFSVCAGFILLSVLIAIASGDDNDHGSVVD
jgi:hypothetical protein